MTPEERNFACKQTPVGKLTRSALYIHKRAEHLLYHPLWTEIRNARFADQSGQGFEAEIIKFSRTQPIISFLQYPEFDSKAHPALRFCIIVNVDDQKVIGTRDFTASENPPILHRKDEFLSVTDTWYPKYKRLTRQEEKAGLLGRSDIGYKKSWERLLKKKRLRIVGHRLMR